MPGDTRARGRRAGAAALVAVALALAAAAGPPVAAQGPAVVEVAQIRAVFWPGDERLATSLAEHAATAGPWPGLADVEPFPVTLIVTRSAARFDSVTRGRLPAWSGAAAFPGSSTIVLRVTGDPFGTLRHELAHLVLARVAPRAPLWFAEGYAVRASEEWSGLDALALNWRLLRGAPPGFVELDRALRGGPAHARAAYLLAASAVRYLEALGGGEGLAPLLARLREVRDLDAAVRATHLVTLADLERGWHQTLRRRYGWLLLGSSVTLFWGGTALAVGLVWWRRRRRDRDRRAALDEGWNTDPEVPGAECPNA